jgi:uncharacterized membrane protein
MIALATNWIEQWFGLKTAAGEGTAWGLDFNWPWPMWIGLPAAVLAVIFIVVIYLREGRRAGRLYRLALAAVRLGLVILALLMIAQATLVLKRTGLPCAAALIDDSQSMNIADRFDEKTREALEDRVKRAISQEGVKGDSSIFADAKIGTVPEGAELTRWNLLGALLCEKDAALLKGLSGRYKLRVYFLTGLRPSRRPDAEGIVEEIKSMKPAGESTRLGAAVRDILDELRSPAPAAVVILSDGVNTEGPTLSDAAAIARRREVPIFCVGIGGNRPVRDLAIADLLVEDAVYVGDAVDFECKLSAVGFPGTKALITLREKGKNETLAKTEVVIGPDGQSQAVRLVYRPSQAGTFDYVVEAEPQEGELQTENNRLSRTIRVRKEKLRALLAWAAPSFEYRYLRNVFERCDAIELHTVLQEADPEHAAQDKAALRAFPERREDLFSYDVIIIGDLNPAMLSVSTMQSLAEFVDRPTKGGALVLVAGPRFMPAAYRNTPLARVMPFDPGGVRLPEADRPITEGFKLQPTELGLSGPTMQLGDSPAETQAIWQSLPDMYWFVEVMDLKPGARVLAEDAARTMPDGRPLPIFVMQYVGAGKVLFHATDETWRWRRRVGDVYFARYWMQSIRYLSRSKLSEGGRNVTLSTDRRQYAQDETVQFRARFADERLAPAEDEGVTIVVEQQGRQTRRLQLRRTAMGRGVFEGALNRPLPGSYHAWLAVPGVEGRAPAVDFLVSPPPGEFARLSMDENALREAAKSTGGKYYDLQTAGNLLGDLPPGRQVPMETLLPVPLWNKWPVILLFLALLIGEWVLRKRGDMV